MDVACGRACVSRGCCWRGLTWMIRGRWLRHVDGRNGWSFDEYEMNDWEPARLLDEWYLLGGVVSLPGRQRCLQGSLKLLPLFLELCCRGFASFPSGPCKRDSPLESSFGHFPQAFFPCTLDFSCSSGESLTKGFSTKSNRYLEFAANFSF